MNKLVVILFLLCLFVAAWLSYFAGRNSVLSQMETSVDTVTVFRTFSDTVYRKPEFHYIERDVEAPDVDSLWKEALLYWQRKINNGRNVNGSPAEKPVYYKAVRDTSFADSLLTARISFISPLPLHPDSYFSSSFTLREREIRETKVLSSDRGWFEEHFGLGISLNMGYDPVNKTFGPNISVGVQYRF